MEFNQILELIDHVSASELTAFTSVSYTHLTLPTTSRV